MTLKHLKAVLSFSLMNLPISRRKRYIFAKWGGVIINGQHSFIGKNVSFDSVFPECITLENNVHITNGCVFLTHFMDTSREDLSWKKGYIHIGENVFIGTNTIIAKPISIGGNSIIGAGSVVTKDIPANEIWAGNPAKFIKKRENSINK